MKINLILVGKTNDKHLQTLIADYEQRLSHYISYSTTVIPELKNARNLSEEQQKQAEGQMILKAVMPQDMLILLDEHGTEYRSIEFAQYIQKQMNTGKDMHLVVGGPFGFSKEVYERANGKISLSKMTFSHQMIRLIFTEQLYRAMTILRGEKYHHE